jgi:branched-chain amino acid transport system substrate-binding protein
MDFSAATAVFGEGNTNAIELAILNLEEEGFLENKEIELIFADTYCNEDIALDVGTELIENNDLIAIIGAVCSSATLAVAPVANENGVVMISPGSTSPSITTEGGDYVFRLVPADTLQSKKVVEYIGDAGYSKLAMIYVEDAYGEGLYDSVERWLDVFKEDEDYKIEVDLLDLVLTPDITAEEILIKYLEQESGEEISSSFEQGRINFEENLETIKDQNPDVLFVAAHAETGAFIVRQAGEIGLDIPIIGSEALYSPILFDIASEEFTEGLIVFIPSTGNNAIYRKFYSDYETLYGEEPLLYGAESYDAMKMIVQGSNSGAKTGEELKDYLFDIDIYEGASGEISFTSYGDLVSKDYDMYQVQNQEFVLIDGN